MRTDAGRKIKLVASGQEDYSLRTAKGANTEMTADTIQLREQRLRERRRLLRHGAFRLAVERVIVRCEDLVSDLTERVRERAAETAPAPNEHDIQPTAEEWAAWADENLEPEDAELFHAGAEGKTAEPAAR